MTPDPEEMRARVERFLDQAKREALDEFQKALQRISKLSVWWAWRAPQIAEEALHWGPYWDKGYGKFPGGDGSPKSLSSYYWRTFRRWAFESLGGRNSSQNKIVNWIRLLIFWDWRE